MDSGNSSSMQSSSGGEDQEYESSRPDQSVVPAFLSGGSSAHFSHPLVSHHQVQVHDHPPTFFDPSSTYLNAAFSQSQPTINSLLSFDGVRPRGGLRSDQPNNSSCTIDLANLPASSTSMFGNSQGQGQGGLNQGSSFPSSSRQQQAHHQHQHQNQNGSRSLTQSDQATSSTVGKNPKKRTRASRRAPTTVLTTDTSNFRAMVQEFTGIPAPPFSASPYSRRLDLFGSGSGMRSTQFEPIASLYPLRPSAKRVQPSTPNSLLTNPLADASNNNNTNAFNPTTSTTSSSYHHQLPSELALLKQQQQQQQQQPPQPQNMLNIQNQSPVLSFQSFLQPPTLHPSLNLPGFSIGHVNANLGGLQRSSDSDSNWRDGIGLNDHGNSTIDHDQDHLHHHLRPLDHGSYGNDHHQRVVNNTTNSCKLNYSAAAAAAASSSDFHHDKGLDNVSSRAEGTVDPWICPAAE